MPSAVTLLSNLLPDAGKPVPDGQLRRLQAAATFDGRVDAQERGFFRRLGQDKRLTPEQAGKVDTWLKAPVNPEAAYVRKGDAAFDKRVAALAEHAKPGDLVFWKDTTGSQLAKYLGEFPHVSLVLKDGKLLDTMTLEGASIVTPEAAVGKVVRRLKAGDIAIGRPKVALSDAQLTALTKAAKSLQGRDYALLSPLKDAAAPLSCSRSVYEAFKAIGVDLAPEGTRMVKNAVMPGDLMKQVRAVGRVAEDGAFHAAATSEIAAWSPTRLVRWIGKAWDVVMTHCPALWELLGKYEAKLARAARRG